MDVAQEAVGHQLPRPLTRGEVAAGVRVRMDDSCGFRPIEHVGHLGGGERELLLGKDMLAAGDQVQDQVPVGAGRCRDVDQVDVIACDEVAMITDDVGDPGRAGQRLGAVAATGADRNDLDAGRCWESGDGPRGDAAGPYDADAHAAPRADHADGTDGVTSNVHAATLGTTAMAFESVLGNLQQASLPELIRLAGTQGGPHQLCRWAVERASGGAAPSSTRSRSMPSAHSRSDSRREPSPSSPPRFSSAPGRDGCCPGEGDLGRIGLLERVMRRRPGGPTSRSDRGVQRRIGGSAGRGGGPKGQCESAFAPRLGRRLTFVAPGTRSS